MEKEEEEEEEEEEKEDDEDDDGDNEEDLEEEEEKEKDTSSSEEEEEADDDDEPDPWNPLRQEVDKDLIETYLKEVQQFLDDGKSQQYAENAAFNALLPMSRRRLRRTYLERLKWTHHINKTQYTVKS